MPPKILVIPGSLRAGSRIARLAALAAKELTLADAEVTCISLADYPMRLYDSSMDSPNDPPPQAVNLKWMVGTHQGVFLATPELNASVPPLVINALGWVSRVRERNDHPNGVFRGRVFAIGAATQDSTGGIRALMALRQVLEIGCGALVLPDQITVFRASEAFDEMDNLKEERAAASLKRVAQRLADTAREMA